MSTHDERARILANENVYIPVKLGSPEHYLEIYFEKEKIFEFAIPCGNIDAASMKEFEYDYVAKINMNKYKGNMIELRGDFSRGFFECIENLHNQSEDLEKRPLIHFTARSGWINDPNGLIYHEGIYHLYYQHNPFNIMWQNMSWGHASSKNLLTWEWHDDVMYPDAKGTVFSGCAIEAEGKLLFPYTVAGDTSPWSKGKPFYQGLAISSDGGMTLDKSEKPFLGEVGSDTRDPKVFWHEESKAYIMILYLEGNDFGIFRSSDLKGWSLSQRFAVEKAWECPDLLKVPCVNGKDPWMFWSADGFYYWGEFDGYEFKSDFVEHHAFWGKNIYATQSYSGINDRIVVVSWLRFKNRNGLCYQGAMGLPREYTCRRGGEDIVLIQSEIREFTSRLKETGDTIANEGVYRIEINAEHLKQICMEVNGSDVSVDFVNKTVTVDGECDKYEADGKRFVLIADYNILEIDFEGVIIGAYLIKGNGNKFAVTWRENGNTEGCGSADGADCYYSIKSFE